MEKNTSNKNTERAHRVGEKSNDKEGAIVVQFSFYKYKKYIFRNLNIPIFEDFSQQTMQIRKKMEAGTSYQKTRYDFVPPL